MLRMTKQADYGIVLLSRMAGLYPAGGRTLARFTAPELAVDTHLPLPMVSKILKILGRGGLLISHRGAKGGYSLAVPPSQITVARMIEALDGPIAFTDCSDDGSPGLCSQEARCAVRNNWRRINLAVRDALEAITLAELATPSGESPLVQLSGRLFPIAGGGQQQVVEA